MKILKRSRKALSPVVASIILIAVTVAVSIAVAAWMGALTFSFMGGAEQVQVGTPYGWTNSINTVNVTVSCPGGNAITITQVRVNGTAVPFEWAVTGGGWKNTNAGPVAPQSSVTLNVTNALAANWLSGYSYAFVFVTLKNDEYQTTGTCP
jgi:flagellin-like protein